MPFWKVQIGLDRGGFSSIFMLWRLLWGPETLWEGSREASRKIIKFRYCIFSDFGEIWRFWGPPGGAPNRLGGTSPKGSKISQEHPWAPWKHFFRDWRWQTYFFDFSIDFSFIFILFQITFLQNDVEQTAWKKQAKHNKCIDNPYSFAWKLILNTAKMHKPKWHHCWRIALQNLTLDGFRQ